MECGDCALCALHLPWAVGWNNSLYPVWSVRPSQNPLTPPIPTSPLFSCSAEFEPTPKYARKCYQWCCLECAAAGALTSTEAPWRRRADNSQVHCWKLGRPKGLCFCLASAEGDWLWVSNCCWLCNLILEFMFCVSNLEIGITHNLYLTLAVHLKRTAALCLRFWEPWEVYLAYSHELMLNICAQPAAPSFHLWVSID